MNDDTQPDNTVEGIDTAFLPAPSTSRDVVATDVGDSPAEPTPEEAADFAADVEQPSLQVENEGEMLPEIPEIRTVAARLLKTEEHLAAVKSRRDAAKERLLDLMSVNSLTTYERGNIRVHIKRGKVSISVATFSKD